MQVNWLKFSVVFACGVLMGCSGQKAAPTITPAATVTQAPTATWTQSPTITPRLVSTLTPTPGPTLTPTRAFAGEMEKGDYLIYELEQDHKLFFYDPGTDVHIPILPEWDIFSFTVSMDDRIAFSAMNGEKSDTYVLEFPFWENSPVNITNTPEFSEYPHSWSPDGDYLLLNSADEEKSSLLVWDGKGFYQIFEFLEKSRLGFYETDWSPDAKFAFAVYPEYGSKSPADIFVWNEDPAEQAVKASIDNSCDDRSPTWSPQGDLAFLACKEVDGETMFYITVWENISVKNGTLTGNLTDIVAPETLKYFSFPTWTNDNRLVFFTTTSDTIYEWNGHLVALMSNVEDPGLPFGWRPDGWWISGYPFSKTFFIHDETNATIEKIYGIGPAWSLEGRLAFCYLDLADPAFVISLWEGEEVRDIFRYLGDISAMWRNGNIFGCGSG